MRIKLRRSEFAANCSGVRAAAAKCQCISVVGRSIFLMLLLLLQRKKITVLGSATQIKDTYIYLCVLYTYVCTYFTNPLPELRFETKFGATPPSG